MDWHSLKKMLAHESYRQRPKPKLVPFLPVIRQILEDDGKAPTKQKHTAHRIFEGLHDAYGYTGSETVAKDAVRKYRIRRREVFLPLSHPPGEALVDFGEATIRIDGTKRNVVIFVMSHRRSRATSDRMATLGTWAMALRIIWNWHRCQGTPAMTA